MLDFEKVLEVATQHIDSLYEPDKRHKGIICPICGNGGGKDGDGVTFVSSSSPVLKCFRCGFSGNVITMTAKAEHISYQEAAKSLAEKLGINSENYQYDPSRRTERFAVPKVVHIVKDIPEEKVDQTEYFKRVEKHLTDTNYPAGRGLSLETCRHFHLGFDAHWKHPKAQNAPSSPRLIIPTSKFSYLAREVRKNLTDNQKRYSKQKFGSVSIFNVESIAYEYTFVTEGEIDAISFYEICRANAVALGSVSNIQKLVDYLKTMKEKKPKYLIAALDNDAAGREGNLKLKQALKEIGINVLIADFIYKDSDNNVEYKDANEILVKNREAFAENVELIWKIPARYYESDKLAGQIIEEMTVNEEKPYREEELASLIKEPKFTAENLQSMFGDWKFSPEELKQMLSKDNPQSIGLNRVKKEEPLYPGVVFNYSFDISKHPPTSYRNNSEYPNEVQVEYAMDKKLVKIDPLELKKSAELLQSIKEFNFKTIYTPEVMWAIAMCILSDDDELMTLQYEFEATCQLEHGINVDGFEPFVNEYLDKFKMIINEKYWASEELKLSDEEKEALFYSSCLIKKPNKAKAPLKKHSSELANENLEQTPPPLEKELVSVQVPLTELSESDALLNQPQSPERDRKLIEFVQKSLERDFNGNVNSSSVANFELALNFDPIIRGCVGYDAFSQRIVMRRKLPWTDELSEQTFWANYDDAGLQNYLNRTYKLNNEQIFFNVISEYAHKNSFHPVRDYLNNLPKWDGITRAAEYFIENLEIQDSRYSREIIKSWMIAAIARVFHPGCKWDYALVIKGEQGVGKSTVFSKIAGRWFNDSVEICGGKENLENLLGSWIVELCEMQTTVITSFLSRQTDKFRISHGRRAEEFPRQCVFAATTNDEKFLEGCTGNRRFLVLVSKAKEGTCRDRLSKLRAEYINQIWAEIFHRYHQLFPADEAFDSSKLLPDSDILEMAKKIREDYM